MSDGDADSVGHQDNIPQFRKTEEFQAQDNKKNAASFMVNDAKVINQNIKPIQFDDKIISR